MVFEAYDNNSLKSIFNMIIQRGLRTKFSSLYQFELCGLNIGTVFNLDDKVVLNGKGKLLQPKD